MERTLASVLRPGGSRLGAHLLRAARPRARRPGALFWEVETKGKEVIEMRKHRRQKAVTAADVALAACRALVPTEVRPKPDVRRALVLARFAVAMTK